MKKTINLLALAAVLGAGVVTAEDVPAQLPGMSPKAAAPEMFTWEMVPEVIASVDGQEIKSDVLKAMVAEVFPDGKLPADIPAVQGMAFMYRMTQLVVDDRLVSAEAAKTGLSDDKEVVKAWIEKSIAGLSEEERAEMLAQLSEQGYTYESWLAKVQTDPQIHFQALLMTLADKHFADQPAVTAEDAKKFYEENPDNFLIPGSVEVAHILLQPAKDGSDAAEVEAKIRELHAQVVANPESFGDVAREFSACPSKEKGGELGMPLNRNTRTIDPDFLAASLPLKAGEISEPVKTQFGWHIITAVNRVEDQVVPYDEAMEAQLIQMLDSQRKGEYVRQLMATLREEHSVEVFVPQPAPQFPFMMQ